MREKRVGGVILAGGRSSRMPEQKLLLPIAGYATMLDAVIDHAQASRLDQLIVVSGAERRRVAAIAAARGVECVYNPRYIEGQSSSLQAGLAQLPPQTAAMILLGDQPFITAEIIDALIAAYRENEVAAVAPLGPGGRRGNPVLFSAALFGELMQITGDQGGRRILERHRGETLFLQLDDAAVVTDIDTIEQYQEYRNGIANNM